MLPPQRRKLLSKQLLPLHILAIALSYHSSIYPSLSSYLTTIALSDYFTRIPLQDTTSTQVSCEAQNWVGCNNPT